MTALREAAEMALEALNNLKTREPVETEIAALRAALAEESKAEPVAFMHKETGLLRREIGRPKGADWDANYWEPLYTSPPQRKPLTTLEIFDLWKPYEGNPFPDKYEFARAIERAHGIEGEK